VRPPDAGAGSVIWQASPFATGRRQVTVTECNQQLVARRVCSTVMEAAGRPAARDDSATATREPIAPANHPSSCNDHDAAAWFAGPVAAARSRPCPPERFVRRACGLDGGYSAVWLNRAHLRRRRSQPGMSCRAARPRLQAPPDGRCPGRGLVTARQGDREHPHPHRRSLLLQACTGPVCPRGRDKAGRPALPSRPRLGHITGARSRQHRLR
jgi:hypothetical protein